MTEVKKAVAAADAQSGHAQQRQAHAGDQEAKNGRPHVPSGHLSQHPLAHPLPIHQSRLGDRLTLLILILVHQA